VASLSPFAPSGKIAAVEQRRRNPFRSEADAFGVLMTIVAAGALVVAVTLLTRPLVGVLVALALAAVGLWRAWGWARWWFGTRGEGERPEGRS
jgi:hypothetical protein